MLTQVAKLEDPFYFRETDTALCNPGKRNFIRANRAQNFIRANKWHASDHSEW